MEEFKIYLSPPSQNGFEEAEVLACLKSNWLAPVGPHLDLFEKSLSVLHQNQPVLALNSGTAALHLALKLAGVLAGDEVIVGAHTHNATVNPIIYQNATPVFVDSEPDTWNMSPAFLKQAIEARLAEGKKPKAIIVIHLYGLPAKLDEILEIAAFYAIPVIEDAAESLGATYKNRPLGTFGHFGILSFNGNKIVTTGGGGAILCRSEAERSRALFLATQARDFAPHFQHSEIGYNYRMSNLLAALGNAQLKNLADRVKKRRQIHAFYTAAFLAINAKLGAAIIRTTPETEGVYANRWLAAFLVKPFKNITNETWRTALQNAGIESRPLWKPMHLQPVFSSFLFFGNHTSDVIFSQGICLPSGHDLTTDQQSEIVGIISSLYS